MIRVEGDHSTAEVVKRWTERREGKPIPEWLFAGGGTGVTPAGQSQTVTQVLEPGTYYAFNTGANEPPRPELRTRGRGHRRDVG